MGKIYLNFMFFMLINYSHSLNNDFNRQQGGASHIIPGIFIVPNLKNAPSNPSFIAFPKPIALPPNFPQRAPLPVGPIAISLPQINTHNSFPILSNVHAPSTNPDTSKPPLLTPSDNTTPPTTLQNPSILLPEAPKPINPFESFKECSLEHALIEIFGECFPLLSGESCGEGEWLVVDEQHGFPQCVPRACPPGEVHYNGRCVSLNDTSVCKSGELLYVEFTGDVYCDCQPGFVFDTSGGEGGNCEAEHSRGSCQAGSFLTTTETGGVACVESECLNHLELRNPSDGLCYEKLFQGRCETEANEYFLTFNSNGVNCVATDERNVFEVPALRSCPPGSRRNYLLRCQSVLRPNLRVLSRRVPAMHSIRPLSSNSPWGNRGNSNSPNGRCRIGYTMFPNGTCMKVNNVLNR